MLAQQIKKEKKNEIKDIEINVNVANRDTIIHIFFKGLPHKTSIIMHIVLKNV